MRRSGSGVRGRRRWRKETTAGSTCRWRAETGTGTGTGTGCMRSAQDLKGGSQGGGKGGGPVLSAGCAGGMACGADARRTGVSHVWGCGGGAGACWLERHCSQPGCLCRFCGLPQPALRLKVSLPIRPACAPRPPGRTRQPDVLQHRQGVAAQEHERAAQPGGAAGQGEGGGVQVGAVGAGQGGGDGAQVGRVVGDGGSCLCKRTEG